MLKGSAFATFSLYRLESPMIEEPPILTINSAMRRPTADQLALFDGVQTGFVADALGGGGALDALIRPLSGTLPRETVVGPALTADCGPADVLATFAALDFIQPGDVLVTAFAGFQGCATAGDRVIGMLKNGGGIAFVTDGPVRDATGIVATGVPVWCTGLTPASPYSKGPGAVGFAVQIGGLEVETGDIVVADGDGVVIVPFEKIDAVGARLQEVKAHEAALDKEVAEGLRSFPAVSELLKTDKTAFRT
ncbi:MAG: RraA family protein [Pseudomonadota bacterium]